MVFGAKNNDENLIFIDWSNIEQLNTHFDTIFNFLSIMKQFSIKMEDRLLFQFRYLPFVCVYTEENSAAELVWFNLSLIEDWISSQIKISNVFILIKIFSIIIT